MTASAPSRGRAPVEGFRHDAFLYVGNDEFVEGTAAFVREGVEAGEPVLVVVGRKKIDLLRASLDGHAAGVLFADMAEVGSNPARIIPAWREFVDRHCEPGRALRGIGEPIFPERSPAELDECHRHESLLNLAFADTPAFWLLCPYDTDALDPDVVDEACRNHPHLVRDGVRSESPRYDGIDRAVTPFAAPLPDPPARPDELRFDVNGLGAVRGFVARRAHEAGLGEERTQDFLLAVNEVATNSVRHASGTGLLRLWQEGDTLICEIRDDGRIELPLVGRQRPRRDQTGGFGLWLANQACDLVQLRSFADGNAIRLHMRRG